MYQLQKICQFDNPYLGEFNLTQHIIMMVVRCFWVKCSV